MPDVDTKLQAALKQAKTKPMFFAFLGKGASDGLLLVGKVKIPPKDIAEAKKKVGGGTLITGRCVGEEGSLVFETGKPPPPTLAAQLKKIAARDAGLTLQVTTRQAADLDELEAETEEVADVPVAPPSPPSDLAQQVTATLDKLSPAIKAAVAAHPDRSRDLLGAVARAREGARINQPGDVKAALLQVNAILKELNASASLTPPPPSPGVQGEEDEEPEVQAEWEEVKKSLFPEVKKALNAAPAHKDRLARLFATVNEHEKAGRFDMALEVAEELYAAIGEALEEAGVESEEEGEDSTDVLAIWRTAREKVDTQIDVLQSALKKTGQPELVHIAEFGLNGVTGGLSVRLQATLMDFASAAGEARDKARTRALTAADEYATFLKDDEVITLCEQNPFGAKVTLRATLGAALGRLRKSLAAR